MSKLRQFDALLPYTIEGLRKRVHCNGVIRIKDELATSHRFRSYLIDYPSGELRITGILNVPIQGSPHPVIVLNHGYSSTKRYRSGTKTTEIAEHLANSDYVTISPDFRGWGDSDSGYNFFQSGLVLDVLNLIDALPSLPTVDPTRVGVWGHSMGARIALKAVTIDDRIKASVLCAPLSFNDTEIPANWNDIDIQMGRYRAPSTLELYRRALQDSDFLSLTSPSRYLHNVIGAVQIHIGTEDKITPPEWADEIYKALKALDKTVEIHRYVSQGHYLKGYDLALMFYRCKAFFDCYV